MTSLASIVRWVDQNVYYYTSVPNEDLPFWTAGTFGWRGACLFACNASSITWVHLVTARVGIEAVPYLIEVLTFRTFYQ